MFGLSFISTIALYICGSYHPAVNNLVNENTHRKRHKNANRKNLCPIARIWLKQRVLLVRRTKQKAFNMKSAASNTKKDIMRTQTILWQEQCVVYESMDILTFGQWWASYF